METLAEQPHLTNEVNHQVRWRNDAKTWLAEVLPGSMRTPFEYVSDGAEIYAEDGGSLTPIFEDAVDEARRIIRQEPELAFELRRRLTELEELADMKAMVRGELPNTMIVVSDFPPELSDEAEDIGGYNVERKQTMLRVITFREGKLQMYSQSLDRSDRKALESIYQHFGVEPEPGELLGQRIYHDYNLSEQPFVVDELTGTYDRSLEGSYGSEWHAGRAERDCNTYDFVGMQRDLLDRYRACQQAGGITEHDKYNIAALITERYNTFIDGDDNPFQSGNIQPEGVLMGAMQRNLDWQLLRSGNNAQAAGQTFSGCGASARPASETGNASEQLQEAGYGNKAGEDRYGSLKFDCPKCKKTNERPRGKLIPHCQKCGADVRC